MNEAAETRVWLTPQNGSRWRFDPGALSLAFGYSGDFGYGVEAWETLRTTGDLDAWVADHFGPPRHPSNDGDLAGAKELRAAITSSARLAAAGSALDPFDVDTINAWARRPAIPSCLTGGTLRLPIPTTSEMLSTIAQDAVHTFSATTGRIRECSAEDCRLVFLDISRPQNRRWCSMSRCGGRAKARSHYARQQTGG